MRFLERRWSLEPGQHLIPFEVRRLLGEHGMIRGEWPLAKVRYEGMFLWILVDVGHEVDEVRFGGDGDAAEGVFEQAAGAIVGLVDGLGVRVKEVSELLAGAFGSRRARDP